MTVCGIIAEYNPFHNGHLYQISRIRSCLGADYVVVVMSGDFVQRGEPAVLEEHKRAEAALSCGADLVIALPVSASTASAEEFAFSGVSILNSLGTVDYLSFGSETEDTEALAACARFLADEPEEYRFLLKAGLKEGMSFPAARALALKKILPCHSVDEVFSKPNNILAVEYLKAIFRTGSNLRPFPVLRRGDDYHSMTLNTEKLPSAAAIRSLLLSEKDQRKICTILPSLVPDPSADMLLDQLKNGAFLTTRDLEPLLRFQLLRENEESIREYFGVTKQLGNRIINRRNSILGYESFCDLLKTKEITRSSVSRALLHIVLGIRKNPKPSYVRVLGLRKEASPLLSEIRSHGLLPLVTRPARDLKTLPESAAEELRQDLFASGLYESLLSMKENRPVKSVFEQPLVIL